MWFIILAVLVQSIWLCEAIPVDLQLATLTTNAEKILTQSELASKFEDWLKHKPTVKLKNTNNSLCGDDSDTCHQCTGELKALNKGKVSNSGKVDQKANVVVPNNTNGDNKSLEPDVESKVESKGHKPNLQSHNTNEHKESLDWHDQKCFGRHHFGKHKDIYPISQQNFAGFACPETESKMIKKDDSSTFISYQRWIHGAPYLYNVYWKDFCELENGKTEQDVTDPLGEGYGPESRICQETLTNAYRGCDNGGTGEEERLPFYRRKDYYPMRIGQLIQGNYQVVAKLGYGTSSIVWLSRDLRDGRFWVLKVHVNTLKRNQELAVYKHLSSLDLDHAGRQHVREVRDTFKISGSYGEHEVFVMPPLGMSLRTLQESQQGNVFQETLVTSAIDQTLLGLNYLHDADVIHTDDSILSTVEDNELHRPSARKFVDETVIHVSQYMLGGAGALTICDLGQARIGKVHRGNAMPLPYRAPEVILDMTWGNSVDLWSIGLLAWDLLHKNGIFRVYDKSQEVNDAHHLAAMTALLGPPPDVFLRRSDKTRKYWDAEGKWHGPVSLPSEGGLESLGTNLSGEDRDQFLDFLAGVLTWLPEDRLTSAEPYFHPWLRRDGGVE
ncbi:CMGC SRPK kinase [Fusarium sp. NRRL 52700]|nr:CMGC SRPK kinase [Fusarium sp. NRRL 52700]